MQLLWVSFAEMFKEKSCFCVLDISINFVIFKGLQPGRNKVTYKLLSITKPQPSTNRMHCSGTEVTQLSHFTFYTAVLG